MAEPLQTMTYEVVDLVARITLDRPERGNGITRRLMRELEFCVERADLDPAAHVILLSGKGRQGFARRCANATSRSATTAPQPSRAELTG